MTTTDQPMPAGPMPGDPTMVMSAPPYAPAPFFPPPPPPPPARRGGMIAGLIAVAVVVLLGVGAAFAVDLGWLRDGGTTPAAAATPTPVATSAPTPTPTSTSTDLPGLLVPIPVGAKRNVITDDPDGVLTLDEVVASYYGGSADVRQLLVSSRFQGGAEEDWSTADRKTEVLVALFQFGRPIDAQARHTSSKNSFASDSTFANLSPAIGVDDSGLFVAKQADADKQTESIALAYKGDIRLIVFVWEDTSSNGKTAATVMRKQFGLLP